MFTGDSVLICNEPPGSTNDGSVYKVAALGICGKTILVSSTLPDLGPKLEPLLLSPPLILNEPVPSELC